MVAARRRRNPVQLSRADVLADADNEQLDAALARRRRLGERPVRPHVGATVGDDHADVRHSLAVAVGGREDGRTEKVEGRLRVGLAAAFTERQRQRVLKLNTACAPDRDEIILGIPMGPMGFPWVWEWESSSSYIRLSKSVVKRN